MGGIVSGILGGGGGYSAPDPVRYDPVPVRENENEPESQAVREAERRKLRARRGMSGTLLTSPLGVSGGVSGNATGNAGGNAGGGGLLGRVI